MPESTSLIPRTNVAPEFFIPKGIRRNSYVPSGVTNAVLNISSSATGICQYPLLRSIFEKNFDFPNCWKRSSEVFIGCGSATVTLFNFLQSTQMRFEPSFFFTITAGEAYGDDDFQITTMQCRVSLILGPPKISPVGPYFVCQLLFDSSYIW